MELDQCNNQHAYLLSGRGSGAGERGVVVCAEEQPRFGHDEQLPVLRNVVKESCGG